MIRTTPLASALAAVLLVAGCGTEGSGTAGAAPPLEAEATEIEPLSAMSGAAPSAPEALPAGGLAPPTDSTADGTVDTSPTGPTAATAYERYRALSADNAEAQALALTAEDAYTRALLGCAEVWPPGSIDELLAIAYADLVAEFAAAGHCG